MHQIMLVRLNLSTLIHIWIDFKTKKKNNGEAYASPNLFFIQTISNPLGQPLRLVPQ